MAVVMRSSVPEAAERDSAGARTDPNAGRRRWRRMWLGRGGRLAPDRAVSAGCRCRNPFGELKDDMEEVVLDVRDLPLTGQIGRTLARMEELPVGQRLRHVNSLVPWPLFAMLETRGYRYRLVGRKAGDVHVLIWSLAQQEKTAPDGAAPR